MLSESLFFLCLLVIVSLQGCSDGSDSPQIECPATDPDNPGNRMVVIGHSFPSGYLDNNVFPESQRWVYPSYISERLWVTYSAPELQLGMAFVGLSTPDLRSSFSSTGLIMSPYHDILDLPPFDTKARPGERHTNLAVPGALLAQALQFDFVSQDDCKPGDAACIFHFAANTSPYSGIVIATGVWPSQVDIAVHIKPKWIIVNIGANDLYALVDPVTFANDFRSMLNRLTQCNRDAHILIMSVDGSSSAPGFVTADEADQVLGLSPGTSSLAYYESTGSFPESGDQFSLLPFTSFLTGIRPNPPTLITVADQKAIENYAEAYNREMQSMAEEFGAIYWDLNEWLQQQIGDGLEVSIDGIIYKLTHDYGGGLWSFQGTHVGKTVHAVTANGLIKKMNSEARKKDDDACQMPLVDVDAVACTDLHVRRALGLTENSAEFTCPEVSVNSQCGIAIH